MISEPAAVAAPDSLDLTRFCATLDTGATDIPSFKACIKAANEELVAKFTAGFPVRLLVTGRADFIDSILQAVWKRFDWPEKSVSALIAVGGYGRGELHPASDIDLLLLLDKPPRKAMQSLIEQWLAFLWDIGLDVGSSVRTLKDCKLHAREDITVATNLMEARLLLGDSALFDTMQRVTGPAKMWPSRKFFFAKFAEQIKRHQKFHDTAYNLEPNIKEGPGGLRDIQMIDWVAKRHFKTRTLAELVGHGFINATEFQDLHAGEEFLWRIRFALHTLTGRHEDRLLFDHQRTIATQFGYEDSGPRLAVELFMKDYYRTITELSRLNEMLLQLFEETFAARRTLQLKPKILNRRFQITGGYLEVRDDKVFARSPLALLEIFLLMQTTPRIKGVRASTIRLIRAHRDLIDDDFRNDIRSRSLFMEILRQPSGITHELRRMNRYGLLARYLPVFGNIVGQMQHDMFHAYTVDEHTLFVVRNLRRFSVPEFYDEFPLCSSVFQRLPKRELLYLAGLFHDIAKGRGGRHSELGAEDAWDFCKHHDLSDTDAGLVRWLVQNHLLMSDTAQKQDISDPDIVNEFARKLGDQAHLDYLYLLTVGDIRATNSSLWNDWKDALFAELYRSTSRALHRGLENPVGENERMRTHKAQASDLISPVKLSAVRALWEDFGNEYFLRYSPQEIARQSQAIVACPEEKLPLVLVSHSDRGGTEVFVYTSLMSNLFTRLTMTLDQLGLSIMEARISTTASNHALDTFIVLEANGSGIEKKRHKEILQALTHALADTRDKPLKTSGSAPRSSKFRVPTQVRFHDDEHKRRTVMEVITGDRPGLLSQIGNVLAHHGIKIHSAKIATFGERAEDMFLLTGGDGKVLSDGLQLEQLRDDIVQALSPPTASD